MRLRTMLAGCLTCTLSLLGCGGSFVVGDAATPQETFSDPRVVELVEAAFRSDTASMNLAMAAGADVNFVGAKGMTPLAYAASMQNIGALNALLAKGADPNLVVQYSPDKSGREFVSAMSFAIDCADTSFLRTLIEHGADPNLRLTDKGFTPVFSPATIEHLKILVSAGARVNVATTDGRNPLWDAVAVSRYDFALVLLDAGADPFAPTSYGTAAELSAEIGLRNTRPGTAERRQYEEFRKRIGTIQRNRETTH